MWKENSWCMELKKLIQQIKEEITQIVPYLKWTAIIFLIAVVLGIILSDFVQPFVEQTLAPVLQTIRDGNLIEIISFIFLNNIRSSFLGIVLGIILGIFPVYATVLNGIILGSTLKVSFLKGVLTIWKILPHGVFELPRSEEHTSELQSH